MSRSQPRPGRPSDPNSTLTSYARTPLASVPTPLLPAPRLAQSLGLAPDRLWLKLDQYTGFAFGGNKVRKLETELTPARLDGVDTLITAGGPQSNHVRVTAAAAARLGLDCVLVINGNPPDPPSGNTRLHRLLTSGIVSVADRAERAPTMERIRDELEVQGRRALVIPLGASTARGALAYALAMVELQDQFRDLGGHPDRTWIVSATSSGGTLAGMVLGRSLLGWEATALLGVSADDPPDQIRDTVLGLAGEAAGLIHFEAPLLEGDLHVTDAYVGGGYGIPTAESDRATERFARTEGVFVDPTYTAKAAAGLIDWVATGRIGAGDRVVFWHTGGQVMTAIPPAARG